MVKSHSIIEFIYASQLLRVSGHIGLLVILCLSTLCLSNTLGYASTWSFKDIESNERDLNMVVPGLGYWIPGATRGKDPRHQSTNHTVKWNSFEDKKPNAKFIINKNPRGFNRTNSVNTNLQMGTFLGQTRQYLNNWYYEKIGDEEFYDHPEIGELGYIRFNSSIRNINKECFFFHKHKFFKTLIDGWYCEGADKILEKKTILVVLASLDLDWDPSKYTDTSVHESEQSDDSLKNSGEGTAGSVEASKAGSFKDKLKVVKEMLDEGLITEEEAAAKRAKLLEDL